ncbi:lipoyl protein ligase domain-containing protein [Amaricoccus macauensis]|uniref:lipoyl protein ligase domain-containing protein n=1 Tax=Amaricoccus macauensis TaxID=57001 RepID=UPI003C7C781C
MITAMFRDVRDGIDREKALLAAGQPTVLLWQAEQNALVIPAAMAARPTVAPIAEACAAAGWPIIARSSGGGGVPQGLGTLNLAIVAPMQSGGAMEDGYDLICGAIGEALTRFEVNWTVGAVEGSFCDGKWNVTVAGLKFAGTAQRCSARNGQRIALIHAALLLERPDPAFWDALELVHAAADLAVSPRPDVHVALDDLLAPRMRASSFHGALARAAQDRLTDLVNRQSKVA